MFSIDEKLTTYTSPIRSELFKQVCTETLNYSWLSYSLRPTIWPIRVLSSSLVVLRET